MKKIYLLASLLLFSCYGNALTVDDANEAYVKGNSKRAYEIAKELANKNNPRAMYLLANFYLNGIYIQRSEKVAQQWFKKALDNGIIDFYKREAAKGDINSAEQLGKIYVRNQLVSIDYMQAAKYFEKASVLGSPYATHQLYIMYFNGIYFKKDIKRACALLKQSAEMGESSAQNDMGVSFYQGNCGEKDIKKAVNWYKKAADNNNLNAIANLGRLYIRGEGLQQDVEKGIKMLNEIANDEIAESSTFAALVLGDTYYLDEFIEPNIEKAIIFYKKACKKQSWFACMGLGNIYAYGFDYKKDGISIEDGDIQIDTKLSMQYYLQAKELLLKTKGTSEDIAWVEKSIKELKEFIDSMSDNVLAAPEMFASESEIEHSKNLQKKAEAGDAEAAKKLGFYFIANSEHKDISNAFHWYIKAIELGAETTPILEMIRYDIYYSPESKFYIKSLISALENKNDIASLSFLADIYMGCNKCQLNVHKRKSFEYRYRAAEKGHPESIVILGANYLYGHEKIIEKDPKKAYDILIQIEDKSMEANVYLGWLLEMGLLGNMDFEKAIKHYERAIQLFDTSAPKWIFSYKDLLSSLSSLYFRIGDYNKSEELEKESMRYLTENEETTFFDINLIYSTLIEIRLRQGKFEEANTILEKLENILAEGKYELVPKDTSKLIFDRKDYSEFFKSINNWYKAKLEHGFGNLEVAKKFYDSANKRMLDLRENLNATGKSDPTVQAGFGNYLVESAVFYRETGELEKALHNLEISKNMIEKYLPYSPDMARIYAEYGIIYRLQNKLNKSKKYFDKAFQLVDPLKMDSHPLVAVYTVEFAKLYEQIGKNKEAIKKLSRATNAQIERANLLRHEISTGLKTEQFIIKEAFVKEIDLLKKSNNSNIFERTFMLSQAAKYIEASEALNAYALRNKFGNSEFSKLLRTRQNYAESLVKLDDDFMKSIGKSTGFASLSQNSYLNDKDNYKLKIKEIDKELANKYPKYELLIGHKFSESKDIKKILGNEEALISYVIGNNDIFVWALTNNSENLIKLNISSHELKEKIKNLRVALNPVYYKKNPLESFPIKSTNTLYLDIFEPIEKYISDKKKIFIIPDAELIGLPFHILNRTTIKNEKLSLKSYKKLDWLVKYYSFVTLPSINLLEVLITTKKQKSNNFLGIGNPEFGKSTSNLLTEINTDIFLRDGQVDVDRIRDLVPLPDTEDEIQALSKLFSGKKRLLIKKDANEINIKEANLAQYDVIAFATHGLMAGDFSGQVTEPALVLTPPIEPSTENNGLLSASEIIQLNLNSELVILSACNTAAGDGSPGAQGLSGLARAFFFAGTESLLVSHWPTVSDAATKLTTNMMERYMKKSTSLSEALRLSMLDLINDESDPRNVHPAVWAPFVLVGAGEI